MSTSPEIAALSIGTLAYAACQQSRLARVVGVTSRGLFLLAPQQVIFVSGEPYRSPVTINLNRSCEQLHTIEVGATAQLSDTRLIFPAIEVSISLSTDVVWRCPLPASPSRPSAEQLQTLRTIAQGVLAQADNTSLAALLPKLIDLPGASPLSDEDAALLDRLIEVRRSLQVGDSQRVLTELTRLLGQGRGLTPSGDDVVIGLLLMLARSHAVNARLAIENMLKHIAVPLVAEAYQRTTAISANLIECAADGQGDERLIAVVDGIATGSTSIGKCVDCVLDWGNSSGVDALVGMAIAIMAF